MCQFMTLFGLWNAIHLVINTLCLNQSDAKFHTTFILTRLTVFECHFFHIYYYLIDISATSFHKICSIFS